MSIIITGNPGVGKHSLAIKLAKSHDLEILDLNQIAIKNDIVQKSDETLDVDIIELKEVVKKKISEKSLVVGHLAPYVMTKHQVRTAIVLRKNPYKLEYIYKKRNYSKNKKLENQGSEILGIIAYDTLTKFGSKKTIQIDTTNRTKLQTLATAEDFLLGKKSNDFVDWLSVVYSKKDMKKFFPTN